LGTKIIKDNILNKKSLSEKDDEGCSKLCLSANTGWNNRDLAKLTTVTPAITAPWEIGLEK
jgi:hypothetical protein